VRQAAVGARTLRARKAPAIGLNSELLLLGSGIASGCLAVASLHLSFERLRLRRQME
jgi:hypothetical protein